MNIESDGFIELSGGGPLCPQGYGDPMHPSHALHVRLSNVAHNASPKDADGFVEDGVAGDINHAINYGDVDNRMRLYRNTAWALSSRGTVAVEALYFHCATCGLIMPANRVVS